VKNLTAFLLLLAYVGTMQGQTVPGPLSVCTSNPRYFCDPSGNIVYLVGVHTWSDVQDVAANKAPNTGAFDFNGFVKFAASHGYTYMRLWQYASSVSLNAQPQVGPVWPWKRIGPGKGNDGLLKTDFTQLNQAYFDRLRARVIQAGNNGIYVSVMLFNGGPLGSPSPTDGNPYEAPNNVNGVSCPNLCPITLAGMPRNVVAFQQAYVKKIVDTVHDLPSAMYEIANEADSSVSTPWELSWIPFVNNYEQTTYGSHHPMGFTFQYPGGTDTSLYNSKADWVAIANGGNGATPTVATGQCPVVTGSGGATNPSSGRCKVVMSDTDHSWSSGFPLSAGVTGQTAWIWENFTMGNGVSFMDPYTMPWPSINLCNGAPTKGDAGLCATNGLDPQWTPFRTTMGDLAFYAKQVDLKNMTPRPGISTTGFALANPGNQYFVFSPNGGSPFTLTTQAGAYNFEWFNTATHAVDATGTVTVGSSHSFTPPTSANHTLWLSISVGPVVAR
jgi:hypothetical protein